MREIKFRAKSGTQWRYGDLYHNERGELMIYEPKTSGQTLEGKTVDGWRIKVDPETVGQSTGMYDVEGREIYEGDILSNGRDTVAVSYKDEWGAYVGLYHGLEDLTYLLDECVNQPLDELKMKIVGNVYDNPELLERKP